MSAEHVTAWRECYAVILKSIATMALEPALDKPAHTETIKRDPIMREVVKIREALDRMNGKERAALSAADAVRDGLATKAAQPPAPEPQGAVDENPAPTHRCKKCGALWRYWPVFDTGDDEDVWSLRSKECGECCDGPMTREQIKPMTLGGMAEHLAIAALQQPHGTNSGARVTDEAVKAAWQTFNRHEDGFAPTAIRAAIAALRQQPVTLREVTEADAERLGRLRTTLNMSPIQALRELLPHGIPVTESEGERG